MIVAVLGTNLWGLGAGLLLKGVVDFKVVKLQLTSELKGLQLSQSCVWQNKPTSSIWLVLQATISFDITIFYVINIDFSVQFQSVKYQDNGHCPLPQLPI
jgi:hypothetical protein